MNSNARNRFILAGVSPIALQLLLILLFFWAFIGVAFANPVFHTGSSNQTSAFSTSGNTQTVSKPANIQAGDMILVTLHYERTNLTITPPSGFTLIRNETSGSNGNTTRATVAAFYKIATSSEPTSYTFTSSGNGTAPANWRITANRITGFNPNTPIGAVSGSNSGNTTTGTTRTVTAINTTANNSLLVSAISLASGDISDLSSPSGMTSAFVHQTRTAAGIVYQTITNTGTTGNKTWNWTTARANAALMFVINPAPADFGDAPASYGDASHGITSNLFLGDNPPSAENSSKTSFNARADDNDDGAPSQNAPGQYIPLFPVLKATDTSYSIPIKVTNTTGTTATLAGWIDFDQSGTFEESEKASVNVPHGADKATVTLNWATIPTTIQLGTTAIRLRLSTDSNMTATGFASNGEVEDYPIAVAMHIPPNSPNISIVNNTTPANCENVVFSDNFNDLAANVFWAANRPGASNIRNWSRSDGGNDSYARTVNVNGLSAQYGTSMYFGNGAVRQIHPSLSNSGFSFDGNGKLLTSIEAIALRDNMDDATSPGTTNTDDQGSSADWGPRPVTLARTFNTTPGKSYRLYFAALPEDNGTTGFPLPGIMRVDAPGGSIHFKAPASNGTPEQYAIEFTALSSNSTIRFINYGHINSGNSGYCDPNSVFNTNPWCSVGGSSQHANELIIDNVILTEAACATGTIAGKVYIDTNRNGVYDASNEAGIANIALKLFDESTNRLVTTTNTDNNGSYNFSHLNTARTYRVEVDTTDPDIPGNLQLGTANPLSNVSVTANSVTNKDFGFNQQNLSCPPPPATTTYAGNAVTWNHNPAHPQSASGGHPYPTILNSNLLASAANETVNNLLTGPTEWELFTTASSVPSTLQQALNDNKYFQYSFTTKANLNNDYVLYGAAMSTLAKPNNWSQSGKYKLHVRVADNPSFHSPVVLHDGIQIDHNNPGVGAAVTAGPMYGNFYLGHYDFAQAVNLAPNKTYYVRFYPYDVSEAGIAGGTLGRIIFDDLSLKAHDCGAPPTTLLTVNDATTLEGDAGLSYLKFAVNLSANAPTGGVSFNYSTNNGTATVADNDYQATSGTLTIPAGQNSAVISIPVVGDTKVEDNETLTLTISAVTNARYDTDLHPKPPQGVIINDDNTSACNVSSGHFGGLVFQDFNQNGLRDSGEIGLANVTVTAYTTNNSAAATATTDSQGWYVLNGLTNGANYRLEFTNLPTGVEFAASNGNSASNVQFVTVSPSCNANLGVAYPADYCQAEPKLLASRYINGDNTKTGLEQPGTFPALLSFSYNASGVNASISHDALASQIGSIWGLAYNRHTKKAFATAMLRRYVGLGSLGLGGIYVVDYNTNPPTVNNFLNVQGLTGINVGSIGSNTARGLPDDPNAPSHDATAFAKVGKAGLGAAELAEDGNTLYVTNLYQRNIIKIDLTNYNNNGTLPTTASQLNLPNVACTNGVARPFALKHHRGQLYAGITCTGENNGTSADLNAFVYAYNGSTWVEKLQIPLNYRLWHADHRRRDTTKPYENWYRYNIPWRDNLSDFTLGQESGGIKWADDAQLLLSDIEFDTNGDMILAFLDRTGLQFGHVNYGTNTSDTTQMYAVFANGDLLKARYSPTNGSYTLESEGKVNGINGEGVKTGSNAVWPYGGIGDGEFYGGERFSGHTENSFGAVAFVPGKREVALNAMNPFNFQTGGTIWLSNDSGNRTRGAELYGENGRFMGKAVGLGDIEVLCDPAPVEIGNRVWHDTDKDGIQDAGESGISNVSVTLTCGADSATTTTNSAGEYYFSNAPSKNATFMNYGESCSLSIANTQASLNGFTLTTANADGKTDNNAQTDIRDSDAVVNGSNAVINFTAGNAGQNNHGLDFGYQSGGTNTSSSTISGTVFEDKNYGGGAGRPATASGTTGINNVRVELYNATGGFVTSTTTSSSGDYTFSNLASGNYFVRVVNDSVRSKRSGANGTERGVQTFRSDGTTATANEVGGRKPALVDAPANTNNQTLNPTDFTLSGGGQAQSVQPITISNSNISGADFGFNFSTIVNANDSGQGSLRQFLVNTNLFNDTTTLAQAGLVSGKENAVFMLPTTDPKYNATDNYWSITLQSALPAIGNNMVLDGSKQAGFTNHPVIELNGTNAGDSTDGLTLNGSSNGAEVSYLAINRFKGAGIKVTQSQNNKILNNVIGLDPTATLPRGNQGNGITVSVPLGSNSISTNRIAYNGGDGINATGQDGRTVFITANSIYANTKLGIDLANNGITLNDANDTDTGINNLLNFPMINNAQLSGNSLTLSGCAPAGATVELFKADVSPTGTATAGANKFGKSKDYGEGQVYLGRFVEGSTNDTSSAACNLATDADGNNQTGMQAFQVTVNLLAPLSAGDLLTATATLTSSGTSEFSPVYAPTVSCSLVVTTTADTDNAANNSGSLRDAIQCANSTPEADTITFNIPTSEPGYTNPDGIVGNGDDYWSIKPTTPLPGITQPLVIDGSTQPGTSCPQPRVEIDGSSAGADADGIGLYTSNSTIKGLIINNFNRYGIRLSRFPINFPSSVTLQKNNAVQCSYIGVNASGLVAKPNLKGGIAAEGDSMKIGGSSATERNIISGNGEFGIYFYGGGSTNGTVQGNYIGVGANGITALGNQGFGIGYYNTDGKGLIGGITGITVNGACTGACNLIAHNTSAGVGSFWTGPAGRNIRISGNSIHSNGGIGIDLEGGSSTPPWELDGVTPNDLGDSDPAFAPNALQNYPVISKAILSNGNTVVTGTLNSIANKTFTIEFFVNTTVDPSGHGEGERYLGNTTVNTDASGNANFTVNLPEVALGTFISSTATDSVDNTSEFSGSVAVTIERTLSGKIFEDINYGGGAGRDFDTSKGMVGIAGASVELINSSNAVVATTTTATDGNYTFAAIPAGNYNVRVVTTSVRSTRPGGNNPTVLGISTYRTDGTTPAATISTAATQAVDLTLGDLSGVNFGFNFDTVSNTNDSGAGSLRQFILNANLLGGDSNLQQEGLPAGKENAVLMLSNTDPNYSNAVWKITLNSSLPNIDKLLILDGSRQAGFNTSNARPVIELNGNGGAGNGLTLISGSTGSQIRSFAITNFGGDGINVQGNSTNNSFLGNSIHSNGDLGIDLADNGVTANDAGDTDTGPNNLLNFPEAKVNSFGTNDTKVVSYDFNLDLAAGNYRVEFFSNAAKDPSGHGEGQTYLGYKDLTHLGNGSVNFKGTLNANQTVASGAFIATTLTRKTGANTFAETSEFSGVRDGITTQVCEDLASGTGSDMMVDEGATVIKLLEAKDKDGNPITYVISGGADKDMFIVENPTAGSTLKCSSIKFISSTVVITKSAPAEGQTRAVIPPGLPAPGNFEVPLDKDKDNVYELQITATYANGSKIVRDLKVGVIDLNEAPLITSATSVSVAEDSKADVIDIAAQDPDTGTTEANGLTFSISGGADAAVFSITPSGGVLRFITPPDYDAPQDADRDNVYEVEITVTDEGGLTDTKLFKVTVTNNPADDGIAINVKALLQGAYDGKSGKMATQLNQLGLLPNKQPYNVAPFNYKGTETLSAAVQQTSGNDAVVDWVLVELRSANNTVIASRALALQSDGDVVDAQSGATQLHFANVPAGNYAVSLRHRNHLAVVTASPINLSGTAQLIDFAAAATSVKGTGSRLLAGTRAMLWAGDINSSHTLTANGPSNDVTTLLSSVITHNDNDQGQTNYIIRGYLPTDVNLDGKTQFSGPGNDTSLLVGNILLHPLNTGFAANYIVRGGLAP